MEKESIDEITGLEYNIEFVSHGIGILVTRLRRNEKERTCYIAICKKESNLKVLTDGTKFNPSEVGNIVAA